MVPSLLVASALLPSGPEGVDLLSCDPTNPQVVAPEPGADTVPINARIWLSRYDYDFEGPSEWVIVGPSGIEVEHVVTTIDLNLDRLEILAPTQPLEPDTHYQLWSCEQAHCSSIATEFTTGDQADSTPPPLPMETDRRSANHRSEHFVELGVDFEGILVVDLGQADLRPEDLEGSVHMAAMDDAELALGEGRCLDNWPGDRDDDNVIRYGSFDVAGNFSGWTEPEPLSLGGCALGERRETPLGLVLLLLAGATGARRRSKEPGR